MKSYTVDKELSKIAIEYTNSATYKAFVDRQNPKMITKTKTYIASTNISTGDMAIIGKNVITVKENAINIIKKQPFFYNQ